MKHSSLSNKKVRPIPTRYAVLPQNCSASYFWRE